ncbi:hypothetical protein [Magnetospirillum molischianum]|uniref:Uncharacterized protein n=1 Tax=Magnetospirillum molischianum DSM 120 TaxID=1150626 RepID=H8FPL0_MAGML|nr:hypothetical protein [Magnetospirillum molischianum]CCG40298.1 conserved exported hypothetical protein [Magnetospirillum molischianum DSM 120]
MITTFRFALLSFALMVIAISGPVSAEEKVGSRIFVETAFPPTTAELEAARKWAPELFSQAEGAGRPVTVRVARSGRTLLISLESVAICDRVRACPLLVFRDITRSPVYRGSAFQNLILDYRENSTWLILRVWETVTECRISGVTKAICRPVTPGASSAGRP